MHYFDNKQNIQTMKIEYEEMWIKGGRLAVKDRYEHVATKKNRLAGGGGKISQYGQ